MPSLTFRVQHSLRRLRTRDTFTRNVVSTFSVRLLVVVLGAGSSAITARWLGAEGKGLLQLCLLAPTMLGIFLGAGLSAANIHYLGSKRFDVPTLTANAMTFAILATLLGVVAGFALIITGAIEFVLPGVPNPILLFAMLGLPLTLLSVYLGSILQGLQRISVLNRVKLINACLLPLLIVVFVIGLELSVAGALAATLITGAIGLGQMVYWLKRAGAVFVPRWDPRVMRASLQFGLQSHIGNIVGYFNYRLDVLLVNGMLGATSVGLYSVATRLAEMVWYFPSAVCFAILPKAAGTDARQMNRFTPRVFLVTLAATTTAGVGLALIGRPLIRTVFSEAFIESFVPMVALLPGVVLMGAARVLANDITGRGYPLYSSIISGVSLVLTVVLNLVLIPRFGIMGAALASTGAYTVSFFGLLVAYRIVSRRSCSPGVSIPKTPVVDFMP